VLGIIVPLLFLYASFPYLTGERLRRKFRDLTPVQAFGVGLCDVGLALCFHGVFFGAYREKPVMKWMVIGLSIVTWTIGVLIKERVLFA